MVEVFTSSSRTACNLQFQKKLCMNYDYAESSFYPNIFRIKLIKTIRKKKTNEKREQETFKAFIQRQYFLLC